MLLYKDIIKEDNEDLRKRCLEVTLPLSKEDEETINLMNEYLINGYDDEQCAKYDIRPGVGIAAPQIDVLKRMFVVLAYDEKENLHHYGVINPKIISSSVEKTYLSMGEGCLSVDRPVEGLIHRAKRITVDTYLYNFETGEVTKEKLRLSKYIAIVFQHEYDHLQGVLFVDHINKENPMFVPENSTPVVFPEYQDENK